MNIGTHLYVYELPSLKAFFELPLYDFDPHDCPYIAFSSCVTFSPDSSYFLLNSLQTCVSVKNQNIVPFIPHGPAEILSSSFSSCGTKLGSAEKQSVKVWDVIKKELITESGLNFDLFEPITCFSRCESYIFLFESSNYNDQLNVFDSATLNILKTTRTDICSVKHDNCIQFFSSSYSMVMPDELDFECWQLTTGERILSTSRYCSMPFLWKGRKCVMTSNSSLRLVVYDYLNQQVIDTFQKSCLPSYHSINYIANLGENNFLICVDHNFVFVLSLESSSEFFAFSFINDRSYTSILMISPMPKRI